MAQRAFKDSNRLTGHYRIIKDYKGSASMCIYCIENLTTGRCYIGATSMKIIFRVNAHFKELRNNTHFCSHLQHTYNACGEEDFRVYTLYENAASVEILKILEGVFCELYRANNKEFGYNTQMPGSIVKHSEESKAKQRASWTLEKKKKQSDRGKLRHLITPIQPPIMSADGKARMILSLKERYKNGESHLFGRKNNEEQCKRISEKLKGVHSGSKNPSCVQVLAYDTENQRQYSFATLLECADFFGLHRCTIRRRINGGQKFSKGAAGLFFKYA